MLKFKAEDTYTIKTHGKVYTGYLPVEIERKRDLIGQLVEIEFQGTTLAYKIIGVESFWDKIRVDEPIGLHGWRNLEDAERIVEQGA